MIKKILCILPVITLLYMAPGTLFAAEGETSGAVQTAVEQIAAEQTAEQQTETEPATAAMAYGPAAEAAAGTEAAAQDGNGSEAQTVESGEEEAAAQPAAYTEEDLYVMAHVLAGECQSCPDQEQLYVGSVVLNRKNHPSFPNTVKGVVFQKGQYSCTRDGNYYREPTERNWANARTLLENGSVLPANVIWQSGGRQGKGVYVKTRWHYYCY